MSGFQISAGRTAFDRSVPSEVDIPPLARTVPSGSSVRFWYARPNAIGAVERHVGVAAFMSMTAVRPSARVERSAPLKSGSAQVPAFMILSGRYMTALLPSNGLVPTVVQVAVAGSSVRVIVSGPASNTSPFESTNMNG